MADDTTNALRALVRDVQRDAKKGERLAMPASLRMMERAYAFLRDRGDLLLAALATAQPEAKPEGVAFCQMDWTHRADGQRWWKDWTCRHCGKTVSRDSADGHPHERCTRQAQGGGEEVVVIDGRRYALDTVRTALLGLAADVAATRPPEDTER